MHAYVLVRRTYDMYVMKANINRSISNPDENGDDTSDNVKPTKRYTFTIRVIYDTYSTVFIVICATIT